MASAVTIVPMPQMGVSVTEGTVGAWHKSVGDAVAEGEPLCDIVTDKVDTEVTAPVDGVVTRLVAEQGETVPVGAPLAELAPPGPTEIAPPATPPAASAPVPGAPAQAASEPAASGRFDPEAAADAVFATVDGARGRPLSSPIARRLATEHEVDLAAVRGSGRRGRIRKADVVAVVQGLSPGASGELPRGYAGVPYAIVPTSPQRRTIAEHMVRSRRTAAHMTTEVEVDMLRVTRVRAELNVGRLESGGSKLSYLPFVARAACSALRDFPDLNATVDTERLIRWREVNLGIAVDTERGLLVPVIRGCDRLNVIGIGDAISDIAERARSRRLNPDDMVAGTFTISNPGSVGATSAMAIINQPQVAILGIPAIVKRPWVVSGPEGEEVIVPRPIMQLAVTFDHRAVDGAYATRFAVGIKQRLEGWDASAYA
jgi:pyruvate dehydrogenase E2 component (dihydrolipoyllysine-residue acetyltransferase)